MIHHLQVRDFFEPCQLVLGGGQVNGFHGVDNLFLELPVNGGVPSEHRLVLMDPLRPKRLFLCSSQGMWIFTRVVWWDERVPCLFQVVIRSHS